MKMKDKLYNGFEDLKKAIRKNLGLKKASRTFDHIKINGREYAVVLELIKVE